MFNCFGAKGGSKSEKENEVYNSKLDEELKK